VDLKGAAVFLDFDGTVSTDDTGIHLLERLAPPEWMEVEQQYLAGGIGSRECMARQWKLLPRNRQRIEAAAREVPLDPGFPALVAHLRAMGADVTMVSDGYGFRAAEVAREADLAILTNSIDWDAFEVVFAGNGAACPCAACGTCKQAPLRAAQASGATTVLVGDGASDAKAAEIADFVFAKGTLADWCAREGIAHQRFTDLFDLVTQLGS
jgi:HAD superfamily phosphoserine phosphatase-like hydrolase